jgi:hypothetical protein
VVPFFVKGVPGRGKRLQTSAGKLHEILLEGNGAEGVLDLEVSQLTAGPIGVNPELPIAAKEARGDPEVGVAGTAEVTEHRGVVGNLHGQIVVRSPPHLGRGCVTLSAGIAAGVSGLGRSGDMRLRPGASSLSAGDEGAATEGEHGRRDLSYAGDGSARHPDL